MKKNNEQNYLKEDKNNHRGIRRFGVFVLVGEAIKYMKQFGVCSTYRRIAELRNRPSFVAYKENFSLKPEIVEIQRNTQFAFAPKISILVPLYNTKEVYLCEMIDSVKNQTYGNWELCLADGSDKEHQYIETCCHRYCVEDSRIKYQKLEKNLGIAENTNICISMSTGEYIALFDHDDLLTHDALFEIVTRINLKKNADVIYTDEDKALYDDTKGELCFLEPHYKSDFNLDLLRSNNYICHLFVASRDVLDQVGLFSSECDGSQDYDFILRCVEVAKHVEHISKILYHWRIHKDSTADKPQNKEYCYDAGCRAITAHLRRMNVHAEVKKMYYTGFNRIEYMIDRNPLVSIILYNSNEYTILKKCLNSIFRNTKYDNFEIIILNSDNVGEKTYHYCESIFENNKKIQAVYGTMHMSCKNITDISHGEYLVFLNSCVEIVSQSWIEEMLSNCQRKEVGVVGGKCIDFNNRILNAGLVLDRTDIVRNAFEGLDVNHPGYFGRAVVQQNVSVVSGRCLMVRKKIYDEMTFGDFDFFVPYWNIDLCLQARNKGFLIVMNPTLCVKCRKFASSDQKETIAKYNSIQMRKRYIEHRWSKVIEQGDPYYNNLSWEK